jgi:hypothetical protein
MTEALHDFRLDSSVLLNVYTYNSSFVHFLTQHNFMCSLNYLTPSCSIRQFHKLQLNGDVSPFWLSIALISNSVAYFLTKSSIF